MTGELIQKIRNKEAKIGVIGLGYVGLPLVIRYNEVGFKVTGFDVDAKKVDLLNKGKSYIKHILSEDIAEGVKNGNIRATCDFSLLKDVDCIIICVPTPLTDKKEPDMKYVVDTTNVIKKYLRKGHVVSLESTTYPGTTDEILLPAFEETGLKVGKDFYLIFSPEREDPGNPQFTIRTVPKIVGGTTPACKDVGVALYSQAVERVVPVSSTKIAEFAKLLENIYRGVNIALVNELKMLADKMGVNIWEVIEAASTKPFGFTAFYPGPGLGGHCIPIDPFYLSWKAKEFDFATRFIELAGEVNTYVPKFVVEKITDALNQKKKSVNGSKILILGIAYKKDVDDMRESPALHIIDLLSEKGAQVIYNDPYVPSMPKLRKYNLKMDSAELSEKLLKEVDAVVIVTNHTSYDYGWITKNANIVVDTRNATKDVKEGVEKIVRA